MATRFSIEAVFKAVDKMSNPLRGMNKNTSKFSRALRTDFAKAQRSVDRFAKSVKQKLGRALRNTVIGVGAAVAVGLGIAAREFIEFENAITAASAKFGPAFQKGTEGFKELMAVSRELGATTEFTATEAAKGLDFLALAGFSAVQSISLLPGVVDLATAAQTDLATSSDIASDSLGAFGLMTDDSAQLGLNFARVMDVMAKTTTTSNTDLVTLFETVKKGAPSFTAAGQSMESFNALAGVMANAGVKGAESGTALRNVMLRLSKPTGEAADVLKKLGIQTQDSQGNFRDVIDILGDFETGLVGMGTAQKTAALSTVFGARAVTGVNILLGEGSDKLRDYRSQLENATGAAGEMAEVMRGSLSNQIATLKSAALEMGFKFLEAFEENGVTGIKSLTEAIRNFDMQKVVDVVKKAVDLTGKLLGIVKKLSPLIISLAGAFVVWKIAVYGLVAAQTIMNGLFAVTKFFQFLRVIGLIAKSKGIWAAAQWALNFAMSANPIGVIMIAILALIGVGVLLVKNWDLITDTIKKVWGWFNKLLDNPLIAGAALIFAPFLAIPLMIIKHWEPIKDFFVNLFAFIISGFEKVVGFMDKVGGFLGIGEGSGLGGSAIDQRATAAASAYQTRGQVQSPISSAERASFSREESVSRGELLIKDQTGRAEMTSNPSNNNFQFQLSQSGGL